MNYTNLTLFALGVLGVLLHNLIALDKINKANKGADVKLNLQRYINLEFYSIFISFIILVVAIIVKHEIKQLEAAGKWLGLAFMTIGYMGQSILVWWIGKANKAINKDEQ